MDAIPVGKLARLLGVNSASGLAGAAGLPFPPSSPLSLRDLVARLGQPFPATDMVLWWEVDSNNQPVTHSPDSSNVPVNRVINFDWRDGGVGSHQADRWTVRIQEVATGKDVLLGDSPTKDGIGGGSNVFHLAQTYRWSLTPFNDFGVGSSQSFTFRVVLPSSPSPPVSLPPSPPTQQHTLTFQVSLALPCFSQTITGAGWQISGPGAPAGQVGSPTGGTTSQLSVTLPAPQQGSVMYTVRSTVAFAFDGLVRLNGVSGPENSQVNFAPPVSLPWTGQSLVARFSIQYDSFNNAFSMDFAGLF